MSIWATQQIHDAAVEALARHPKAATKTRALVTVSVGNETKAVLLRQTAGAWEILDLYTADHETPGAVGVFVVGVW